MRRIALLKPPQLCVIASSAYGIWLNGLFCSPARMEGAILNGSTTVCLGRCRMQRRRFITMMGATTLASSGVVRAQQQARNVRHLGVLLYSTPQKDPQIKVLREGLHDLGYVEGQNISIEYRFAEGKAERLPD